MKALNSARIALLLVVASGGSLLLAAPPKESDWRERVRKEVAALAAPKGPPGAAGVNPIDAFLADWWTTHDLKRPARCDDTAFVRRVHVDLIGLLPDAKTAEDFLADTAADKRARLIDRLLADK